MTSSECEVSHLTGYDSPEKKCRKLQMTELEEFDTVFGDLLDSLTIISPKDRAEIQDAITWFKEVSAYNVPFGKKNRGMSVLMSFKLLRPEASEEDNRLARILGWCIEWLQAFFLVADDVMDKSLTRRGKPCWYKKILALGCRYSGSKPEYREKTHNDMVRQEGVGLTAVNDAVYLEACVYQILKNHFRGKSYYIDLVELFHEVSLQTVTGQCLDMITSPEDQINFDQFTPDRYTAIVKWKTAFYSFYLPVALAMHMAGINEPSAFEAAKSILLKMGIFFQIQDDYLDCYGDPETIGKIGTDIEDNKCSWLIVQALERVDDKQRQVLQDNYGRSEPEKVARVKSVYEELNLTKLYKDCEESSYQKLMSEIKNYTGSIPKDVFIQFANKIYKRNK